jgi:ABC-type transport system involved in multi-copper enzyme maturation permease subunit
LMNHLYPNSITIFHQTKLIFHYWDVRKVINQSLDQDKFLILIQFIFNILCFLMVKIIKKSEEFNVVQDSYLMKN